MARRKSIRQHHKGGVLVMPRSLIATEAYKDLNCVARAAMVELQAVWEPSLDAVHYSTRRLADRLGVTQRTAARALVELRKHGFVQITQESRWNGRSGSLARKYKLLWLGTKDRPARKDYEKWKKIPRVTRAAARHDSRCSDGSSRNNPPSSRTENQQVRAEAGAIVAALVAHHI